MTAVRFIGLLLAATTIAACGEKAGADDSGDSTPQVALDASASSLELPVVGESVVEGDLVLSVAATGTLKTMARTVVKSEAQGTVAEVLVNPGDQVTSGQVLARLDTKPLELALARAEASLRNAQVRYRTEIEPDSAVSGQPPSEARRAFARASSGLETAEVDLREARLNLERAEIRAPFAGVVERVEVAKGERINSGEEIAEIVDVNNLYVEANVMEHDIPLLSRGGDARVSVAAQPGRVINGKISAVLPVVDSARKSGTAIVRIQGDGKLRPGMFADVRLEANRLPNRIIVPKAAVIEREGRPLVWVVKDGRADWVYINAGRSNERQTEVMPDSTSGLIPLKPGDIVLVAGHLTLVHQAPVRLVSTRETEQ